MGNKQNGSYMYGHGVATIALAELYGQTKSPTARAKLDKIVKVIVSSQNNEGGWRYRPIAYQADVSVTVSQVMALRAARDCGIVVPKETIDRAVDYVKRCQNSDGGFMYQLTRRGESLFLMRHLPRGSLYHYQSHYFYGHYYSVQAMWQAGGDEWERWYPAVRDEMVAQQKENGRWTDPTVCDEYGTAMALLVLQMPNNLVPIFQR